MEKIKWEIKENAIPQGKDDFFYDLNNGYIKPEEVLNNPIQIYILNNAIMTINSFENFMIENDLLDEV